MLKEFIYLTVGLSKKMDRMVESVIEEGKKELEQKNLLDVGKEHLEKRKEMIKDAFSSDIRKLADELGLATKDDIEQLKSLLKNRS